MIVFVTAYDRFAVQAFEARAIDYLLKPVDDARFRGRARRACASSAATTHRGRPAQPARATSSPRCAAAARSSSMSCSSTASKAIGARHPNGLPIRKAGRRCACRCSPSSGWTPPATTCASTPAGNTHILRATMREMEELLDPRLFQRVHRSTIVNLQRVKSLRAHMNGEYFLPLEGGQELKLSRTYRDKVEYFLKRNHQV